MRTYVETYALWHSLVPRLANCYHPQTRKGASLRHFEYGVLTLEYK
jgi:hypothetical protein